MSNSNQAVSIDPIVWVALPAFAAMYLRPQVESLQGMEQIADYVHHLYAEEEQTTNVARIVCLVSVREALMSSISK